MIGDGVGWWVSWMAWVSGSAMAMAMAMAGLLSLSRSSSDGGFDCGLGCSAMTMVMAGLLSLDQAQMVGLMVVWGVSSTFLVWKLSSDWSVGFLTMVVGGLGLLVVVGWLFFGSGCELCCLWCFFCCCSMYYFIVVDILFYCDDYIILLYWKLK